MNDKKLWKWFSLYIRLRDSDDKGYAKCCTCGTIRYYRDGDCGHGIPRQHMGTKYSEKNNHFQCKRCNGFEGGVREKYKAFVDKKYGAGTWDVLNFTSRTPAKIGQFEVDIMTNMYKKMALELAQTKTLKDVVK